jgi:hypothetical protein
MTDIRTFTRAFAGGEITPEMAGRIDDSKSQMGLRTCRNYIVKPHGPVQNRGGLEYLRPVKNQAARTRVWPFYVDADEAFVVEIGGGYFRFFFQGAVVLASPGGAPLEVANPYAAADIFSLKIVQSGDVWTLTHPLYPAAELRRTGVTTWVYTAISFTSPLAAPTGVSATATPAGSPPGTPTLQSYVITAVQGPEEGPASNADTGAGGAPSVPTGGYSVFSVSNANPGVFVSYDIPDAALTVGSSIYLSGLGGMAALNGKLYEIDSFTWIDEPGVPGLHIGFEVTLEVAGTPLNTTSSGTYTGGGTLALAAGGTITTTGVGSCSNNLFDDGAFNTIAWQPVSGAERYNIYKLSNGLFGYIGQTQATSFTDDNIAADISKTPPIIDDPFAIANRYPAAVGYFEQRRWFAGGNLKPDNAWATRTGTESNLSYSIPTRDDDSIRFRVAARERNSFRHVVPLSSLVLLSDAAEWLVAPAGGSVLTPDVALRAQSFIGSGEANPIVVNSTLLFAAARGGHIREMAYNETVNGYVTGDVSIRAAHLFDDYEIVDMAYAKGPVPIVWAVSTSGRLLGFTYVPEEQIGAWHWHDTLDGVFESVCVVPEGQNDVLYCIVQRGSNRYVERMRPRRTTDTPTTGFFVDCGLEYVGTPATTISGLAHLNGKTVSVLADGKVLASRVVSGGQITLEVAASRVVVGLPITADIETLPVAFDGPAFGQGRHKNVSKIWAKLFASRSIKAGPSFDALLEYQPRAAAPVGGPPPAENTDVELTLKGRWGQEGRVCMRHDIPVPQTILAVTLGFTAGG